MSELLGGREWQTRPLVQSYLQVATSALLDSGASEYLAPSEFLTDENTGGFLSRDRFLVIKSVEAPEEGRTYYRLAMTDGTGQVLPVPDFDLFSLCYGSREAADGRNELVDSKLVETVLSLKELQDAMGWTPLFEAT